MTRLTKAIFVGIFVTLVGTLAFAGMAPAGEKPPPPSNEKSVLLTRGPKTDAVMQETKTTAELVFESCAITTEGELTENKLDVDKAKLEKPVSSVSEKPNCEATEKTEVIEKAFVSTFNYTISEEEGLKKGEGGNPGETGLLVFEGKMKYRTSSPKCTYLTEVFKAELTIKGYVNTGMESNGARVTGESEAACPVTKTVHATGMLYWEKPSAPGKNEYYAIRKSEK